MESVNPPTIPPTNDFMTVDTATQLEIIMGLLTIDDSFSKQLRQKANERLASIMYIDVGGVQRQVHSDPDKQHVKFYYSGKSPRRYYLTSYLDENKNNVSPNASKCAIAQYNALINPPPLITSLNNPPSQIDADVVSQNLDTQVLLC